MEYGVATARKRDLSRLIGRMVAPQQARSPMVRYGVAIILPFGGFLINWLVFDLQRAPYFSLFMATVVFTSLFGGQGPGILNTILSTVLGFLVAPPAWTYRLTEREDAIRIGLFFLVGCLISIIVGVVGELQRKLNRERSTLQTILQTIGDAVITTDADARITFLNDIAETTTGWRLEVVRGRPIDRCFQVISEDSRSQMKNPVSHALQSRTAACHVADCLLVRRDGTEIPIVYSATPIQQSGGSVSGGVLTFRDITRQRETHNALIRAEKLATAGKLAATLAHQVNNPLEAALNLLFLIQSTPDLKTVRSCAQVALQQVMRAAHFVRQTLSFAKPSDRRSPVDLCGLLDEVLALHSNRIEAKGAHIVKTCPSSVKVYAHRSEIEQVVSNLISNSLDAIPYGGKLLLHVRPSGGNATFAVGDTGCGIPREHFPKIFGAFFTTKSDVGVGLGLWVAKRIIEAHHGQIRLRSCSGTGTVVRVTLQALAPQPSADSASSFAEVSSSPHQNAGVSDLEPIPTLVRRHTHAATGAEHRHFGFTLPVPGRI